MQKPNTLIINFGKSLSDCTPELHEALSHHYHITFADNQIALLTDKQTAIYIFFANNNDLSTLEQAIIICRNLKKKIIIIHDNLVPSCKCSSNIFILSLNQVNFYERLQLLLKLCCPAESHSSIAKENVIASIPLYIDQNLASIITESETARFFGYSSSYFSKLFYRHFGRTFKAYVTHARIRQAKRLLAEQKQSKITHIAYCCGFNDVAYFSKVFKKKTGTTPAAYRQSY
ncbi:AraC family transcriptional regulator [Vibrio scophthalmi]|uniref:helix-turn-helix domain-containing protein n=1 Tax=Vibrio TaxID=662 RepID=UPI00021BFAC4|nr:MULTISPECIES: AraC family transcriptional regulator [Vibrio]EGU29908.1 transcriptional regulator AraC family protein [Vibrio sp. N418]MCY9804007.1 AraC family transcriptional regulator [Vibrio scophthalmi]